MTIQELKLNIINNTLDDELIVFVCSENSFLANQYIDEISESKLLLKNDVSSLSDLQSSALALVMNFSDQLNILRVDTFDELLDDYSSLTNCIVVCNKVDKKIEPMVKEYIVSVPKLKDWQIKDYMRLFCSGLTDEEIDWMYDACKGDIYRCVNEIEKISQFKTEEQRQIFYELQYDKNTDLFVTKNNFEIIEAILHSDKIKLIDLLSHRKCCDLDAFLIISSLLTSLKRILYLNFNSGVTAEQLGITPKQVSAYRYYYKNCSEDFLRRSISFLSSLDNKVKNGELELENDYLVDFIICHVLNFY